MRCMYVLLFCVAVAVSGAPSDDIIDEWRTFKLENHKTYKSDTEEKLRMKIYAENKLRIAEHNQRFKQKLVTFRLKLNQYADLKQDEYIHAMFGFDNNLKYSKLNGKSRSKRGSKLNPPTQEKYPGQMDWREKGAVTGVKNQGACESCWAFSSTGALEGQLYRKTGSLVPLSEQNLIDCSWMYGNRGCLGGRMDYAFDYVKNNGSIATELSYPYEATVNKCRYRPVMKGIGNVRVVGYEVIPRGDEKKLMQAVATVGPVSVAIDASKVGFEFYYDGVFYDPTCSSTNLTHAMLVVGYGTDKVGGDYWLVKNSYGVNWGDKGYIKMARNRNNHCGIATNALYPKVK